MLRSVVSRSLVRPRVGLRVAQSLRTYSSQTASSSSGGMSLKELTKKYGWAAFGVYMTISAIDLPLSFVFVHSLGQDRVTDLERSVRRFFGMSTADEDLKTIAKPQEEGTEGSGTNWGLLLTEFGIAYAIHKSIFLFVRIPATAAITPWAVKTLRKYGFNIGGKATSSASKAVGTGVTKDGKNLGTSPTKRQRWWWFF